jgi:hypothetical protein
VATATRQSPCPQCRRRRQRLRAHSPLANTLCAPVSRWGFTLLALAAFAADLATPALVAAGFAAIAWRYR